MHTSMYRHMYLFSACYVCIRICVCSTGVCVYIYTYQHAYMLVYICIYICGSSQNTVTVVYTCTHAHTGMYMYIFICIYTYTATGPGAAAEAGKRKRKRPTDPGHVPSFARRVCPKTTRAATQWNAIKDCFKMVLHPRLSCPSSHEDHSDVYVLYIYIYAYRYIGVLQTKLLCCFLSYDF